MQPIVHSVQVAPSGIFSHVGFLLITSHSPPPHTPRPFHSHSTSLSSVPHPSFPLLSFVSPALSFSPVAGANCDIPLHFGAGATLSWDAAKRHWGGGRCSKGDGGLYKHRPSHLVSLTDSSQLHTQCSCLQPTCPPPHPMAIASSPVGARMEPREKQHQHQSGAKTPLSRFFSVDGCFAVGGLVWETGG